MQCSKETIVRLFYNASTSFQLLFLFFYLTSILLSNFFVFISTIPLIPRSDEEYEYATFSEEEEEEEEEGDVENNLYYYSEGLEKDDLVADVTGDGQQLSFTATTTPQDRDQEMVMETESVVVGSESSDDLCFHSLPESESESESPAITTRAKSTCISFRYSGDEPSLRVTKKIAFLMDDSNIREKYGETGKKLEQKLTQVDKFLNLAPLNSVTKKPELEEKDKEEIFGDTNTIGSTSKSSSEWRSSINCRDPSYDPFSSSSRRSCPKWESYTVFQKYDEEMLFLDRISAQKLQETESFRSSERCHSSISEKIIQKLAARNRKTSYIYQNSYRELECAYVAQICLTWEALAWNYNYFQQLRVSRKESDPGCPAYVAQQFQQFQVLLQRYIENEPYENGRRPIVYARIRSLAPKLLQVPEYRDSDEEKRDEYLGSRVSSDSFGLIMEEAIKTFMNFLKADTENRFQSFTHLFRIKSPTTHVLLLKKVNHKKKMKLKELRRSRKCLRKRRSKPENGMEMLMAQIDLKVVSRVLRSSDLSEQQMHWCEDKMSKVRICDGKLQRDSSPLFFPAH